MKKNNKNILIIVIVTLVLFELASRFIIPILLPKSLLLAHGHANADPHWIVDNESGWTRKPDDSGLFTDGIFAGRFTNDKLGNRLNADESTFTQGNQTIYFVGDSTAVSLEVDNNETIAAYLEQDLRSEGLSNNVLNLGVRGYGTDQSYLRAKKVAQSVTPKRIIYLYNGNDIFNNNSLKMRLFAKPAFVFNESEQSFKRIDSRVKAFNEREVIILDETCRPHPALFISDRSSSSGFLSGLGAQLKEFMSQNLMSYRIVRNALRYQKTKKRAEHAGKNASSTDGKKLAVVDPSKQDGLYEKVVVNKQSFSSGDARHFSDQGQMRIRCREYYDKQMRFIMQKMTEIPGVEAVDVISFPHAYSANSSSRDMFESMVKDGIINSYLDLPAIMEEEGRTLVDFVCHRGDDHLCEHGNRWIADKILQRLTPKLKSSVEQEN